MIQNEKTSYRQKAEAAREKRYMTDFNKKELKSLDF